MTQKLEKYIKLGTRKLLSKPKKRPAGRSLTVYPDDTFVTSYPRSGNTWVRFLIANIVWSDSETNFLNIEERVPDVYQHSNAFLRSLPRPRILKCHEYFDPRFPKVLYVVRDVRSVLISYRYYQIVVGRLASQAPYTDFTKRFLAGELDKYGSWRENVLSWMRVRGQDPERFLLIRYEDLHKKGIETLRQIASFLGLERSDRDLEAALKASSFDNMQVLERRANWLPLTRSGQTDEWKQILDHEPLELIRRDCEDVLSDLGYSW